MLEHLPQWLGALLRNVRAGHAKLTIVQEDIVTNDAFIDLRSPAFTDGERLPERFTADGAGLSPPLFWGDIPDGTASLVLLVEDPDAPTPQPLVHALVWAIPPTEDQLPEGTITHDGDGVGGRDVGRNSYLVEGWLPPDPPNGHGSHDYVFQLFALSQTPELGRNPGRSEVVRAMTGHVLAAGMLVGTYSRGEARPLPTGSRAAIPAR
ncbi:MAG TPA: YbhB/YbcL family Raf kinase inhibitor-like protein [Sphingobium sp.]|uniref:YbhB/YbcL family Raf kinase inhibitor-like protein n=1 Tax=Sphingobium sp. TaxID=1912891 RepID=UPI002ED1A601